MTPIIHTFTGRNVNPLDLQSEDICIEDIAHALALCNRFAGHTREPISVAQHSVYVARLCHDSPQLSLLALLHDASEAYLGDMTKWVKGAPAMEYYRQCEARTQSVIERVFFPSWWAEPQELEQLDWADRVMVRFEGERGCGQTFKIDHPRYPPLTDAEYAAIGPWRYWNWRYAEFQFLIRFDELRRACAA